MGHRRRACDGGAGSEGIKLDEAKTADAITQAALGTSNRVATVVTTDADPELTTAQAQAMGIVEKIESYTTTYVGDPDRQVNVRLTTKYASDVMVPPGGEYNFDKTIGPRTPQRGYLKAPGIVGPGKLEDVYGGGICQVSTTMFNAVFFAGLKVTERVNHSLFISHYPLGRDATVTDGGPNLRWVNDTDNYILVRGSSNGITTTFVLYGTNPHRKVTYTTSSFYNIQPRTDANDGGPDTSRRHDRSARRRSGRQADQGGPHGAQRRWQRALHRYIHQHVVDASEAGLCRFSVAKLYDIHDRRDRRFHQYHHQEDDHHHSFRDDSRTYHYHLTT